VEVVVKRFLIRLLLVGMVAAAVAAFLAWPRLADVATGKTPQYPDIEPATFRSSEAVVFKAAQDVMKTLSGWEVVGVGSGPGGSVIHAVHTTPIRVVKEDVTIEIRRKGGRTRVDVRSRSQMTQWDFGQNARNIRELLGALRRIHEDDLVLAFHDIRPQAPHHALVVPKRHMTSLLDVVAEDEALLGHMVRVARMLADSLGMAERGFRLVFNCGDDAGYSVFHIHLHLLGGRPLGWPPG
jgi:histidine triad (HIT) family protein